MTTSSNIFALTKQDTAVLKGIAIIAMLMHHLWGCPPEWVTPYTGVLGFFGNVGKVCVAIFLFCSVYGLSVGYSKVVNGLQCTMHACKKGFIDTLKFLAKRFVKFYAGYWPIFLIFVPISVYFFGRPLSAAYGEHVNIAKRLVYDLMGVQGFQSYNITWWFNKLIIYFYLLFPVLYWLCHKAEWLVLIGALAFMGFADWLYDYGYLTSLADYTFPFVLGICLTKRRMATVSNTHARWFILAGAVVLLVVSVLLRCNEWIPKYSWVHMDGFITLSLVGLLIGCRGYLSKLNKGLAWLGKHSMNIYLMHTFFLKWTTNKALYGCELGGGHEYFGSSCGLRSDKHRY